MSEMTYTLEEAKRELQRRECAQFGHSWDLIKTFGTEIPLALVCPCGRRCRVEVDA